MNLITKYAEKIPNQLAAALIKEKPQDINDLLKIVYEHGYELRIKSKDEPNEKDSIDPFKILGYK